MAIGQFGKDFLVESFRFNKRREFPDGLICLVDAFEVTGLGKNASAHIKRIRLPSTGSGKGAKKQKSRKYQSSMHKSQFYYRNWKVMGKV